MKWYLQVLGKYATFQGRAGRKEYWMFTLVENCLVLCWLAFGLWSGLLEERVYLLLLPVYSVCTICPRLAVTWRRYHDLNKGGVNFLWILIPFIGPLLVLISMGTRGTKGENDYGADPQQSQVIHG
ncbi:DUF805 domain-containing protein [Pseudomonas sp. OV226]|uniref:DUF805 domain-containing protein n=1 Tax=Pseudomonas sp. OV226 TaxID=2135588 RepID=UPI000D6BE0E1